MCTCYCDAESNNKIAGSGRVNEKVFSVKEISLPLETNIDFIHFHPFTIYSNIIMINCNNGING